jgi:hypothetical protein
MTLSPQDINQFKEFLKDKESYILRNVASPSVKIIIEHVFQILQVELNIEADREAEKENKYFEEHSQKFDERREMKDEPDRSGLTV